MAGYSRYDKQVAKAIRQIPKPVRYTLDIVDHNEYIEARVYKNEIFSLSEVKQGDVMKHLSDVKAVLDSFGVKVWFNGVDGDPPKAFNAGT